MEAALLEPLRAALAKLTPQLEASYAARAQQVQEVQHQILVWMADALTAPLREQAAAQFDETRREGRRQLVRWINAECRLLGLAVACPKTGRPSLLMTHAAGRPEVGSFKFQNLDERGRVVRPCYRNELAEFKLVPAAETGAAKRYSDRITTNRAAGNETPSR